MKKDPVADRGTDWEKLPAEIQTELSRILRYWEQYSLDHTHGGFAGRIEEDNTLHPLAPKGSVLNARILWTFSAAFRYSGLPVHLEMATRAFHYLRRYLTDPDYGGLYWSVDYQGAMLESHKQVYAQAFGIYGMSEYYRATGNPEALEQALEWYQLIEKFSRDKKQGGYIDAFARDWGFLENKRLSAKDENASKTMNTHLHVVEAYANLYEVWPSPDLQKDILDLLALFEEKILDRRDFHLGLFFTDDWQREPGPVSFGHDIEAGWLLQACAASAGDSDFLERAKKNALLITDAAMQGLDTDGGLWYEWEPGTKKLIREKHWWPQAEALIGFCNAWQISGEEKYRTALLNNWQFIKNEILDYEKGEWFWGIDADHGRMAGQDKVGLWKCPYHNTRACLELLRRLGYG